MYPTFTCIISYNNLIKTKKITNQVEIALPIWKTRNKRTSATQSPNPSPNTQILLLIMPEAVEKQKHWFCSLRSKRQIYISL